MNKTQVNFIFLRHGNACHNAIKTVGYKKQIGDTSYTDPELTHFGVDMSSWMGCLIKNMLKIIGEREVDITEFINTEDTIPNIEYIDLVGASPLIRSMETAYFMSSRWKQQPQTIKVFPFLRELDEEIFSTPGLTKYSNKSIYNIPEYAMKSIGEQQEYLRKTFGQLESNRFDFSSVIKYKEEREEPGDIRKFINWFYDNLDDIIRGNGMEKKQTYNVLIITHAGVIREFFRKKVLNNMGCVLQTTKKSTNGKKPEINIGEYIDIEELFTELENTYAIDKFLRYTSEHVCGNDGTRCRKICEYYNFTTQKPVVHMKFKPNCREINAPILEELE